MEWRVREIWPQVNFVDMGPAPSGPVMSGKPVAVRANMKLAGLQAWTFRVECVIGRIGTSGGLEETEVVVLPSKAIWIAISPYSNARSCRRRPVVWAMRFA